MPLKLMTRHLILISFFVCLSQFSRGNIDSTLIDSSRHLNNTGIDFLLAGDYFQAEIYLKASFELKKKIYGQNPSIPVANGYNNIGLISMRRWQYDSALTFYKLAEDMYRLIDSTEFFLANINSNIGTIYRHKGDYTLSKQYYDQAFRQLNTINSQTSDQKKSEVLNRLGLLETQFGNYQSAILYYKKAIQEFNNKNDKVILIAIYHNLARAYYKDQQLQESEKAYIKALSLSESTAEVGPIKGSEIKQNLSLLKSYQKDKDQAFDLIISAKRTMDSIDVDSTYYYVLYDNLSRVYESFDEFNNSIYYRQLSLFMVSEDNFSNIFENPSPSSFRNHLQGISQLRAKAECLIKWNNAEPNDTLIISALDALETATQLIDISRNSYLSLESKLLLAENETSVYSSGIKCSYNLFERTGKSEYLNKAFYFAEKNKSSVLSSVLHEEKAKSFSNIPKQLLEKEQSLKREITFYQERIYEETLRLKPDSIKLNIWKNYLFEYTREQDELRNHLEDSYPEYYTLKYNQQTPNIQDIQKLIRRNTSIIEYTMTDSLLYVFNINKKNSSMYEIKIDSTFLLKTIQYLKNFRDFSFMNQGNNIYSDFESASHEIYNTLLAPIGIDHKSHNLIIIPDDILSYIPFESLIKSNGSELTSSYVNLDFLINHYAISYSYSASLLHNSWTKKHKKIHNKLLAISPTYKPESTDGIVQQQPKQTIRFRDKLQPIPYAMDEAKRISIITKGEYIIGENATEEIFNSRAGDFDILHLAMHTIIDDNNPLYSKLVFYDENYSDEDGLLTTNEIFGLNLNAKMTVLSSCSSGEGEIKKGEGVLSLARGFFYAGCPSLVMTLWKVEDKSGLILMQNYYKYLIKGYSKPVALQKSKLDYINAVPNEKRHPFYWSAYICIGNPSPIYYPRAIIYSIISIVVFAGIIVLVKFRKKKISVLSEPNL